MGRDRRVRTSLIALLVALFYSSGCTTPASKERTLSYEPESFRAAILERVSESSERLSEPPFLIGPEEIERARTRVMMEPPGPARVQALVDFLSDERPAGLGLRYDWATSATASRTLALGRGNCVALASVLVGLGRGLGWPIYYAEARTRRPQTDEFEEITALSDHMVVIIVARTVRMIVDFTGLIEEGYTIRPIDDLTAYAHLINNIAGRGLMSVGRNPSDADWEGAREGFELATRVDPTLGRAWNNLGIAYTRLGRFDEARAAYHRALELDTAFDAPVHNLTLMETRATGEPAVIRDELPQ